MVPKVALYFRVLAANSQLEGHVFFGCLCSLHCACKDTVAKQYIPLKSSYVLHKTSRLAACVPKLFLLKNTLAILYSYLLLYRKPHWHAVASNNDHLLSGSGRAHPGSSLLHIIIWNGVTHVKRVCWVLCCECPWWPVIFLGDTWYLTIWSPNQERIAAPNLPYICAPKSQNIVSSAFVWSKETVV